MMPDSLPPAYVESTATGFSPSFPEPSAPAYSELPPSVGSAGFQPVSVPSQSQSSSSGFSHISNTSFGTSTDYSYVQKSSDSYSPSVTYSYRPESHWFGTTCKVMLALLGWTAMAMCIVFAPAALGVGAAIGLAVLAGYASIVLTTYAIWDGETAGQVALCIPLLFLWIVANSNRGHHHCHHHC